MVRQNLVARGARSEQFQDILHPDPQPTNGRATTRTHRELR